MLNPVISLPKDLRKNAGINGMAIIENIDVNKNKHAQMLYKIPALICVYLHLLHLGAPIMTA